MTIYLQRSALMQPRTSLGKSDVCRGKFWKARSAPPAQPTKQPADEKPPADAEPNAKDADKKQPAEPAEPGANEWLLLMVFPFLVRCFFCLPRPGVLRSTKSAESR